MNATEEHLKFLDALRDSGKTKMWRAGSYLIRKFGMSNSESHEVLFQWMESFSERHKEA